MTSRIRGQGAPVAALALALAACNPLAQELPEMADGIRHYQESRWVDAEQSFDASLAKGPSSEAHFNKGAALYQQGKHADALEQQRRALSTRDDAFRSRAYLALGNTQAKSGQLDPAIESYRRALELVPDDPDARYNLEWALRTKQQQQEQKDQKQSGNGDPDEDQPQSDDPEKSPESKNEPSPDQGESKNDSQSDPQKDKDGKAKDDKGQDAEKKEEPGKDDKDAGQKGEQPEPRPGENEKKGDKPGEPQPGESGEAQNDAQPSSGEPSPGEGQPGEEQPRPMSRQEATEVLDALQAGEKKLQMWKFQDRSQRRSAHEQDW